MKSSIQFIFNNSELGAGTRGASLGANAILVAARSKSSLLFKNRSIQTVKNFNEFLDRENTFPFAKHIDGMLDVFEATSKEISNVLAEKKFPLIIAGDHCSAGGTIKGIQSANPGKRLGVVWLDAHSDLHSPYTSPSGNLHGMPIATALGIDNLESQRNNIDTITANSWNKLKSSALRPEDLVYMGVRDTEKEEDYLIQTLNLKNFTVEDVRSLGISKVITDISARLQSCDIIYVSFDVDSMDPDLTSYGTGTPVKGGFSPEEIKGILKGLLLFPKTIALELVEVNPCLDDKNKMAEVALDILEHIVEVLDKK